MATYAVGDIQGCFAAFERLLGLIGFDSTRDRLWLAGDLVNRGPDSLAVLRFAKRHADSVVCVLGNHDLHLLATALGVRERKPADTFDDVLVAPDRDELLAWFLQQRLAYREKKLLMVHAGLLPQWRGDDALARAAEVEQALRRDPRAFLRSLKKAKAGPALHAAALTRLRVCDAEGEMNLDFTDTPERVPAGFMPWFDVPTRQSRDHTIVFGHWSALGLRNTDETIALDTGCVWGGPLTAVRLEDRRVFQT
jgi:bis(5'-nucleosyl)-tetraphosphatase (symmetrical)